MGCNNSADKNVAELPGKGKSKVDTKKKKGDKKSKAGKGKVTIEGEKDAKKKDKDKKGKDKKEKDQKDKKVEEKKDIKEKKDVDEKKEPEKEVEKPKESEVVEEKKTEEKDKSEKPPVEQVISEESPELAKPETETPVADEPKKEEAAVEEEPKKEEAAVEEEPKKEEAAPVEEPKKEEAPKEEEPPKEVEPETLDEPVPPKNVALLENGCCYDLDKLERTIYNLKYLENSFGSKNKPTNIFLLDYDDRDTSKELIVNDQKTSEGDGISHLGGKKLDRSDEGNAKLYGLLKEDIVYFPNINLAVFNGAKRAVVFPIMHPVLKTVFRLILVTLPAELQGITDENIGEKLKKDDAMMKDFLKLYAKQYLWADMATKFSHVAPQVLKWIQIKGGGQFGKDVHLGLFFHSKTEKEEKKDILDSVMWVSGCNEWDKEELAGFKEEMGQMMDIVEKKRVETKNFYAYRVNTKVEYGETEPLYGILVVKKSGQSFENAEDYKEHEDVIFECTSILGYVLRKIKDMEEDAEEDPDSGGEDEEESDDDGEESDAEDDKQDDDDDEELYEDDFFEELIRRHGKTLRKLKRSDRAEMVSFGTPPPGAHAIMKSTLFLLKVSKKSVKDWGRCKKIMKTKFRNHFAAIKKIKPNKVPMRWRRRVLKEIEGISAKEAKAINKPIGEMYSFIECCSAYWAISGELKDFGDYKEKYAYFATELRKVKDEE